MNFGYHQSFYTASSSHGHHPTTREHPTLVFRQNIRQHWGRYGDGHHSSWIGLSSPAQAPVKERDASQEPSPKETPAAEDKNPKPSTDEDNQE